MASISLGRLIQPSLLAGLVNSSFCTMSGGDSTDVPGNHRDLRDARRRVQRGLEVSKVGMYAQETCAWKVNPRCLAARRTLVDAG